MTRAAMMPATRFSIAKKPMPIGKAIRKEVNAESWRGERFFVVSILPNK